MLSRTVHAVWLNLLLFVYLTESFVLLTANVEDIKQIAKKFLSESLSDQIAEFISKAKTQDALSEENERNAQEYRNSREIVENGEQYKYNEEERKQDDNVRNDLRIRPEYEKPKERPDKYRNIKRDPHNYEKNRQYVKYNNAINFEEKRPVQLTNSAYVKDYKHDHQDHHMNRFEIQEKSIQRLQAADNSEAVHPKYTVKNRGTTEVLRNEFDQYDNTNFPKNDLLATSGQVVLPRVRGYNRA